MINYQSLSVQTQAHVATVTLNRPEVRNAFNDLMIVELTQLFAQLSTDASVRAIVLTASGSVFCAGADLQWMHAMAQYSYAENLADARCLATMLYTIYTCNKPVIAKVQGDCYGGGLGLISACDVIIAVESAQFCLSEVSLGLIPATIAPYVLRAMGEQAARRYFSTAERFSAAQAQQMGMLQAVADMATLESTAETIVQAWLKASPDALQAAKVLVSEIAGAPINTALMEDTAQRIAAIRSSPQGKEGLRAFLEKRKPGWT